MTDTNSETPKYYFKCGTCTTEYEPRLIDCFWGTYYEYPIHEAIYPATIKAGMDEAEELSILNDTNPLRKYTSDPTKEGAMLPSRECTESYGWDYYSYVNLFKITHIMAFKYGDEEISEEKRESELRRLYFICHRNRRRSLYTKIKDWCTKIYVLHVILINEGIRISI